MLRGDVGNNQHSQRSGKERGAMLQMWFKLIKPWKKKKRATALDKGGEIIEMTFKSGHQLLLAPRTDWQEGSAAGGFQPILVVQEATQPEGHGCRRWQPRGRSAPMTPRSLSGFSLQRNHLRRLSTNCNQPISRVCCHEPSSEHQHQWKGAAAAAAAVDESTDSGASVYWFLH